MLVPCRTACAMMGGWRGPTQSVRCVPCGRPSARYTSDMVPIWYPGWLEMTAGVVGPNQGQLPPTSPLALFSNGGERERERERERAWYTHFFFRTLHLSASSKTTKFQGGLRFFLVSAYLIIVFITSMN